MYIQNSLNKNTENIKPCADDIERFDGRMARSGKVRFEPIEPGKVSMYVCGPTVYDKAHLGHGRSAVVFDVIRKYLREFKGYEVTFVSNYTDIDDKMIKRAKEEGISVAELAEKVIPMYERDYGKLGIEPADVQPRATDHIDDILRLVEKLEVKGLVYVIDGDGVYYDVSKFEEYGKLSGQKLEELRMGARVDVNNKKRNPYDFAVWKFKKEEGEPAWASKWGEGRPGWHIECSAMSWAVLGEKFDIHGGGLDLKFPHHECEIAQSEGAFGEGAFAKYWLHNGFVKINDEKMSKSLNNFFTLEEMFEKYDPQVVRLMYLRTHYLKPINFSEELLKQAEATLSGIQRFAKTLMINYDKMSNNPSKDYHGDKYLKHFDFHMDNNFNTSEALGAFFGLQDSINLMRTLETLTKEEVDNAMNALEKMDKVLGIIFPSEERQKEMERRTIPVKGEDLPEKEQKMLFERNEARRNREYHEADTIRAEFEKLGYELKDGADGKTEIFRIS